MCVEDFYWFGWYELGVVVDEVGKVGRFEYGGFCSLD